MISVLCVSSGMALRAGFAGLPCFEAVYKPVCKPVFAAMILAIFALA
jgi:hypothetical protein